MNAALFTARPRGKWLAPTLAALVLAGCVTPKIDWSARVGNYTYDQAVTELGPPDKSAKLTDGTVVADWLTHTPRPSSRRNLTLRRPAAYFGPLTPMRTETYVPAQYLRLTFGADGKLKTWKGLAG